MDREFQRLRRTLLLVAAGQGMVLWYAIEKLYYLDTGISLQQVVALGVVAQGAKIVFELPTSVYADRWSRKHTLIASHVTMIVASIILGASTQYLGFVAGLVVWSASDSLRSGVYEAFVYDSLKIRGWQSKYRQVYTRMVSAEMLAMGIGAILAGWIGQALGLRTTFFLTVLPVTVSLLALLTLKEPEIKRTVVDGERWFHHIGGALKVMKHADIRWAILLTIAVMSFTYVGYNNYQLVGVDVSFPRAWFGVLLTVSTGGMVIAAELAHKKGGTRGWLLGTWLGLALALLLGLRLSQPGIALANLFVMFLCLRLMRVYLEVYLHDHIPSERRATILSLASTLTYVLYFILISTFTLMLNHHGIRIALTLVGLPMLLLGLLDILNGLRWASHRSGVPYIDNP